MCPCLWRTWWQRSAKAWIVLIWLFLQVCPLWLFLIHNQILWHLIYLQRSFALSSIVYFQKKHCFFWTWIFNCEWSSGHLLFILPGWSENTEAIQRPAESHSFPAASCQGVLTLCPLSPHTAVLSWSSWVLAAPLLAQGPSLQGPVEGKVGQAGFRTVAQSCCNEINIYIHACRLAD